MLIPDYELQLQQEVDPIINFRQNPGNLDIVGIYYGDVYTETAIPSKEIFEERSQSYCDNFGYPHRGSIEATQRIKDFIARFNSDEEFRNDMLGIDIVDEVPQDAIQTENIVSE
jgi:hypothetical protein